MSQTVRPEVAAFVTQVRGHLSDLSPEEVEELTGGLEADLEDRVADTLPGRPPADLGDPAVYAAELRAAAGLPPRGAGGGRRAGEPGALKRAVHRFWAGIDERAAPFADAFARQPWWPEFRASVAALRPVWWLARGWIAWVWLSTLLGGNHGPLPASVGGLVLLLLFLGVSVALGRGLLDARLGLRRPGRRRILVALNWFAVLLLPWVLAWAGPRVEYVDNGNVEYVPSDPAPGLALNGEPVTNVFAYDAQGRPLGVVQLFDQNGRPLDVAHSDPETLDDGTERYGRTDDVDGYVAPFVDDRGRTRWNVFPLPGATFPDLAYDSDGNATPTASPSASIPPPPLVAVPPVTSVFGIPDGAALASSVPTATRTSGPTPTATPTATQAASPTATPTSSPVQKVTPSPARS